MQTPVIITHDGIDATYLDIYLIENLTLLASGVITFNLSSAESDLIPNRTEVFFYYVV